MFKSHRTNMWRPHACGKTNALTLVSISMNVCGRAHQTGQVGINLQSSGDPGEHPLVPDVLLDGRFLHLFITEGSWLSRAINSVILSVIASAFWSLVKFLLMRYFFLGGAAKQTVPLCLWGEDDFADDLYDMLCDISQPFSFLLEPRQNIHCKLQSCCLPLKLWKCNPSAKQTHQDPFLFFPHCACVKLQTECVMVTTYFQTATRVKKKNNNIWS